MPVLIEPAAIVLLVLGIGGVYKLLDPIPTRDLLVALGLPASRLAGRAVGVVEVAIAGGGLVWGGSFFFAATALAFVTFAAVTLRIRRLGEAAPSCGCFGKLSAEPSLIHVVADGVAALVAVAAAVLATPGFITSVGELDYHGLPQAALVAVATWLAVMVITVLPTTLEAVRRGPAPSAVQMFEIKLIEIEGASR